MNKIKFLCQYPDSNSTKQQTFSCQGEADSAGFYFWHKKDMDKFVQNIK
jgi:hypothetical protein